MVLMTVTAHSGMSYETSKQSFRRERRRALRSGVLVAGGFKSDTMLSVFSDVMHVEFKCLLFSDTIICSINRNFIKNAYK